MSEILSREEFEQERDGYAKRIVTELDLLATIDALATALNAHPENPTELKAHEDLVDMLREKGWIT